MLPTPSCPGPALLPRTLRVLVLRILRRRERGWAGQFFDRPHGIDKARADRAGAECADGHGAALQRRLGFRPALRPVRRPASAPPRQRHAAPRPRCRRSAIPLRRAREERRLAAVRRHDVGLGDDFGRSQRRGGFGPNDRPEVVPHRPPRGVFLSGASRVVERHRAHRDRASRPRCGRRSSGPRRLRRWTAGTRCAATPKPFSSRPNLRRATATREAVDHKLHGPLRSRFRFPTGQISSGFWLLPMLSSAEAAIS